MAQITTGIRAVLSHPTVYSAFQAIMGAHRSRQRFVSRHVRPVSAMRVLDIGCGPADVLEYLPDVEYVGFDISPEYIARAKSKFGARGHFQCGRIDQTQVTNMESFDVVFALGLLHHLEDAEVAEMMRLARHALKPDGRLVTVDPCLEPGQNPIARFLVRHDRGMNVRNREGYRSLAAGVFGRVDAHVEHQRWIPYTHCIMECHL